MLQELINSCKDNEPLEPSTANSKNLEQFPTTLEQSPTTLEHNIVDTFGLEHCLAPLKHHVATQCHTKVKCYVSVAVQTSISSFDEAEYAEKSVQFDGHDNECMTIDPAATVHPSDIVASASMEKPDECPLFVPESQEFASESDIDVEDSDSDFEAMDDSSSQDSDTSDETDEGNELVKEKKYLVFESELFKLFTNCPKCSSPIINMEKHKLGSMLSVKYSCLNGHILKWNSQPLINAMPGGNLLLSAAILFSGNTYTKISSFSSFCGMLLMSETKYYNIQKTFLWPTVNKAWNTHQKTVLNETKKSGALTFVEMVVLTALDIMPNMGHTL